MKVPRLVTCLLLMLSTCALFQAQAQGKVSLRFYDIQFDGFNKPHQMNLDEYMKANPGVSITLEAYSDYWTKIPASIAAGTEGDIVYWMSRDLMPFFIGGQFLPLPKDVMTSEEMKKTFWPESLPAWEYDNKYWGLPEDYNVEGFALLVINVGLLKKHGFSVPPEWIASGGPKTWDDLLSFAKKITQKRGSRVTIPGYVDIYDEWSSQKFFSLIFQAGGDYRDQKNMVVHFNTPEGKKALTFLNDVLLNQGVDDMALGRGISQFITNANAFMSIAAPHWGPKIMMEQPDMEWIMLKHPPIFGNKPYWNADGGWGYSVSARSKNASEAWKFVKFCSDRNRMKRVSIMSGVVPTLTSLAKDPDIVSQMPQAKYFKPMLEIAQYGQHVAQYVGDQGQMRIIVQEEIEKTFIKEKSIDQALADMDRRVNAMIKDKWEAFKKGKK